MSQDTLARFLTEVGRLPFVWGLTDCLMMPADWIVMCRGVDPASPWRGRYDSEREARRLMKIEGGIMASFARGVTIAGMPRTQTPQRGDVGLVRVPLFSWHGRVVTVPAGAICTGNGLWAVKQDRGLSISELPCMAAWSVAA